MLQSRTYQNVTSSCGAAVLSSQGIPTRWSPLLRSCVVDKPLDILSSNRFEFLRYADDEVYQHDAENGFKYQSQEKHHCTLFGEHMLGVYLGVTLEDKLK